MQVIENKAEVEMAEVPHTPIATSAGAKSPAEGKDEERAPTSGDTLRRIDFGWRGETCGDCVWFVEDEPDAGTMAAQTGGCHRRPPVFRGEHSVMGAWPKVRAWHDVCGDGEVMVDED